MIENLVVLWGPGVKNGNLSKYWVWTNPRTLGDELKALKEVHIQGCDLILQVGIVRTSEQELR